MTTYKLHNVMDKLLRVHYWRSCWLYVKSDHNRQFIRPQGLLIVKEGCRRGMTSKSKEGTEATLSGERNIIVLLRARTTVHKSVIAGHPGLRQALSPG